MTTTWGHRVRPFLRLVSVVLFLVLVRTQLPGWDSASGSSFGIRNKLQRRSPQNWQSQTSYLDALENRRLELDGGAGRHLLGVERGSHPDKFVTDVGESTVMSVQTGGKRRIWDKQKDPKNTTNFPTKINEISVACENVRAHLGFPDSCSYVRANKQCQSTAFVKYTEFFYCTCASSPGFAYVALSLWLVALFYMLGNTAADYFCCSLEKLSNLMHLSPTVAGVSLLPFGNGAPDVFASIVAFMGSGHSQVGLNSVLGGAFFVTSVVAGSVSLAVSSSQAEGRIRLDCCCFLRDVGFFLVSLVALCCILVAGKIYFWGAVAYLAIYVTYTIAVVVIECAKTYTYKSCQGQALEPFLASSPSSLPSYSERDEEALVVPSTAAAIHPSQAPVETQWKWAPHVAIYSHTSMAVTLEKSVNIFETAPRALWGWREQDEAELRVGKWLQRFCFQIVDLPLTLPRRLTIPIIKESPQWSRPFAIASATLSPTLLAAVWDSKDGYPVGSSVNVYVFGIVVGVTLGILAFSSTVAEHPPRRFSLPWVAGGFIMSIVWFYLIANELVAALVAVGVILEVDAAILGLTVLAWGNSIGDLMSNHALAANGADGIQIAMSGCYAGPMFNALVGLGLSFLFASWRTFPHALVLPTDNSLFYTLGFLILGLLWALVALPANRMTPSKGLGIGLLLLYASFLSLRLVSSLGLVYLAGL